MTQVSDIKDSSGRWVKSYSIASEKFKTNSYRAWSNMKKRCEVGGKYQTRCPTYVGCTFSDNFSDFQYFANWYTKQIGYGIECYNLDKDLLVKGNKEYNEGVCVLVPQALNLFLTDRGAVRGEWPQGVSWHKQAGKFRADISINGKQKFLGYFTTTEEASTAYKAAKTAEARRWYQRLVDGEFVVDPRVIERLANSEDWAI